MIESAVAPEPAPAWQPRLWWLWSLLLLAVLIGVSLAGALARARLERLPGNLPSVTGARGPRVLGAIYAPFATPR